MRRFVLRALLMAFATACTHNGSAAASDPGLAAKASMTGTVQDASTGMPIPGATVSLTPDEHALDGVEPIYTTTVGPGSFEITNITPGGYVLDISARGYVAQHTTMHFAPSEIVRAGMYRLRPLSTCPKVPTSVSALTCR